MNRNLARAGVIAGALFFAHTASAGVLLEESYMGMVNLQTTNWSESLSVNQFDTQDGQRELVSICIHLEGGVSGSASLESLDNAAAKVVVKLSAEISLSLGEALLGVVVPIADDSFSATAFDGTIDFAGSSGTTFSTLSASDMTDIKLGAMDEAFASFIGDGSVKLTGDAMGTSYGAGAGNLVLSFQSQASLSYEIVYKYREVPAPGAALILAGVSGVAARRRRS